MVRNIKIFYPNINPVLFILIMRINFAFVSLAIMLIAGIVAAIPESEVNSNDPDLFQKIIDGIVVIDPPQSHKRQSQVIAKLCIDENLVNCLSSYDLTTTNPQINNTVTGSPYGITSVQLLDRNYILVLYRQIGWQGETRGFRTTFPINDLADQGDFDDKTASAKVIYLGSTFYGANLWEGSDYSKRVSYVVPGSYSSMTNSGCGYCLSIGNDKLSSFEVMPGMKLELWKNSGFTGTYGGPYPPYSLTYSYYCPNMNSCASTIGHDTVSSFKVTAW